MYRQLLPLFLLAALPAAADAQLTGKTYAETKREQDRKKYNEDQINANRYNRNTPSKRTGKVDDADAKALAEKFRHNAGRGAAPAATIPVPPPSAEALELQKQEADRKQREEYRRSEAQYQRQLSKQEQEEKRKAARVEYFNEFKAIGLTEGEAWSFALNAIPIDADRNAEWVWNMRKQFSGLKDAYTRFAATRATATYEELAQLADKFQIAGYAHIKAQQFLATRFPGKLRETELGQLIGLFNFYSGDGNHYPRSLQAQYVNMTPAQREELESLFLALYARHPEAALAACATAEGTSPVLDMYERARKANDREAQTRFAELGIRIPPGSFKAEPASNAFHYYLASLPGYLESKPASFWIEVAQAQRKDAAGVISAMDDRRPDMRRARVTRGKIEVDEDITEAFTDRWVPVLQKVAATGDPSAANALGVLSAGGKVRRSGRKEAVAYWQQAAAAGYFPAYFNLLRYASAGLKGGPDKDALEREFVAFTTKATPRELYNMAYDLVNTNHGDHDKEMTDLGKMLGKAAADRGVKEAKDYYKFQ